MEDKPVKILLITQAELSTQTPTGNTFNNLFGGMANVEFANICCRAGKPDVGISNQYFYINEKQLLHNLIFGTPVGQKFLISDDSTTMNALTPAIETRWFNFARKYRFAVFFWIRELIWSLGRWKSNNLTSFVDEFEPDVIFVPLYGWIYVNRLVLFLKKYTNKPLIIYAVDDHYTLNQFSTSIFYWLNRIIVRNWVIKVIKASDRIFVISEIQKSYFCDQFGRKSSVLFKGGDFSKQFPNESTENSVLKFVYTGGLGTKRYVSLSQLGRALDTINEKETKAELHIYSQTPLNQRMRKSFDRSPSIVFHGRVSHDEVIQIQRDADVLVHVESFELKSRLAVMHSFSTKIVDYFNTGKCIFAIGWEQAASIAYLIENDAAIVATSQRDIQQKLEMIVNNKDLVKEYAFKAWECGRRNHQMTTIQQNLYDSLTDAIK